MTPLLSLRWVPAAPASAGKIPATGPQWGKGPYPWWRHHHNYTGELEEGGSWGDKEGGGDGHRHGWGGGSVTAVPVTVFSLQQHLLHHGGSQPGLDHLSCYNSIFVFLFSHNVPQTLISNPWGKSSHTCTLTSFSTLVLDAFSVPVLSSLFPGHLSHSAVWEYQPQEHQWPFTETRSYHQGPLPGINC